MKSNIGLGLLCALALGSAAAVRAEDAMPAAEPANPDAGSAATPAAANEAPLDTVPVAVAESAAASAEPVAEPERSGGLQEIIVTAQKRAENLQDVPIAIQAFSGDTLTDKGITDTQALTQITPGLVYNSNAGYAMAYVRGVGSDAPLPTADPSVATYVDGVYYPFVQSTIQSFADLQRIEVLKGPQGTLFGRNTTAGAISIVTKDPGDTAETSITYEIGNYGKQRLAVYGATPVSEAFAVGVSGFFERFDSYYEQTHETGPEILDYQNWGLRAKLAYDEDFDGWINNLRMVLTGYALDHHGADTNVKNQFQPSYVAIAFGAEPTPKPYKAGTDLPDTNYTRIEGATLKGTLGFTGFDLVSISGYQNTENYGFVDFDATPAPSAGFGAQPGLAENFSQELQIVSTELEDFDLVGGAYYFSGSGGFVPLNFILTGVIPGSPLYSALLGQVPNLPLPTFPVPNLPIPPTPQEAGQLLGLVPLQDLAPLIPNLPGDATYAAVPLSSIVDTKAHAFFTQGTWRTADWLRLTAGLRYSDEERILSKNAIYQPVFISDADDADQLRGSNTGTPIVSRPARKLRDYNLSTKFVVEFPFENIAGFIDSGMLYLGRTEGFKSGTWNTVALTNEPDPVKPEEVVSYEGGFKTDLFGGYARLNASVFAYDYENLQLTSIALTSGGAVKLENAGKAKVKGVEFEATIAPTDQLTVLLNGSLLDTKYTECRCSGFDETSGLGFQTENGFDGNELVNAPKFSGTFDISYRFEAPGGELEAAGTAYHNDGHFFDSQNSFAQPSYELYSARLTYSHGGSGINLTLFGQNLSDELYFINGNVNDFGRFGTYGTPRTYGARVQWQF